MRTSFPAKQNANLKWKSLKQNLLDPIACNKGINVVFVAQLSTVLKFNRDMKTKWRDSQSKVHYIKCLFKQGQTLKIQRAR